MELADHTRDPDRGWDERQALAHWAGICGPTAMDQYLHEFIKREVALRPDSEYRDWQRTLCRLIESAANYGMPMERLGLNSFAEMLRQSRNAEEGLLALHMACGSLTKAVIEIQWRSSTTFGAWFKRLQGQRAGPENTLAHSCLEYLNLAGCVLDFMDLFAARLNGADLRGASLEGAILWNAQCHETNLLGANLVGANLRDADLSKADLSKADLREANFSGADFLYANLADADLARAHGLEQAKNLDKTRNLDPEVLDEVKKAMVPRPKRD
uniref:Pentapeptide repeat-containing protein n=1 Tax=Candidatus Kentrum sp. TUN TaxID=2126343 RepID=A0A450ZKF3_9GAMM|nr:MAG: Pentapeptide repeat-containing protein [Candidatus Kentron sp. TUN]VFK56313.1 MAG: Pentapeptide repeat-containing protein [Candidatus Kentron sp. TUN]